MFISTLTKPLSSLGPCLLVALLASACAKAPPAQAPQPSAVPAFAQATGQPADEGPEDTVALLQPVEVTRAFASRQEDFQACFERERQPAESKVVVSFLVTGQGSVGGVQPVAESVHNDEVVRCVVGVVEGLKFRETPGGATRILFTVAYDG